MDIDRNKGLQWLSGGGAKYSILVGRSEPSSAAILFQIGTFVQCSKVEKKCFLAGSPMAFSDFKNDKEPAGSPFLHMNFDAGFA